MWRHKLNITLRYILYIFILWKYKDNMWNPYKGRCRYNVQNLIVLCTNNWKEVKLKKIDTRPSFLDKSYLYRLTSFPLIEPNEFIELLVWAQRILIPPRIGKELQKFQFRCTSIYKLGVRARILLFVNLHWSLFDEVQN